jgi:hypothetical protein
MARLSHEAQINISNTMVLLLHSSLLLVKQLMVFRCFIAGNGMASSPSRGPGAGFSCLHEHGNGSMHARSWGVISLIKNLSKLLASSCNSLQTRTDVLLGDIPEYSEEYPGFYLKRVCRMQTHFIFLSRSGYLYVSVSLPP